MLERGVVIGVVAVGVVVVGAGCPGGGGGGGACDAARAVTVGPDACDADACAVDFGAVTPGLSSTVRVFVDGACDDFFFGASIVDEGGEGVFAVGDNRFGIGDDGNDGFVFVEATPKDEQTATATLRFDNDGANDGLDVALVVNP